MLASACAAEVAERPSEESDITFIEDVDVARREYVEDLAWRYLFLEVDDEGARLINEEIRALSSNESRILGLELLALGNADSYETAVGLGLIEIVIRRGISMLDLTEDDVRAVIDEVGYSWPANEDSSSELRVLALCLPLYESCTVWNPGSTTSLYGYNSLMTGTTASWSDRLSTSECELGGCDHRFYFSGTHTLIDGKTTAYDNWIASYSSILGSHSGSATYALMGNGQAVANWIVWVDASQLKMY